jgi:hypothetical protein
MAPGLFGGHEVGRADELAGHAQPHPVVDPPSQAKVEDLHSLRRRGGVVPTLQKDVGGLDIAVDQPAGVGRRQALGDLAGHSRRRGRPEGTLAAEALFEGFPLKQFHGEERRLRRFPEPDVVNGGHPLVLQGGEDAALAQEPLAETGILGQVGLHDLQRHPPPQPRVLRLEDHAHAALTEQA